MLELLLGGNQKIELENPPITNSYLKITCQNKDIFKRLVIMIDHKNLKKISPALKNIFDTKKTCYF